jgi:hypothetical protein
MRGILGKGLRYASLIGREVENNYGVPSVAQERQEAGAREAPQMFEALTPQTDSVVSHRTSGEAADAVRSWGEGSREPLPAPIASAVDGIAADFMYVAMDTSPTKSSEFEKFRQFTASAEGRD